MRSDVTLQCLGVVAAFASAISAYLNWRVAIANREYVRQATNRQAALKYEELIAHEPRLLDLHGFSHQTLLSLNLTQLEVAYLLSSFTAGDLYYQDRKVLKLTEYRKTLLESAKVRVAWTEIIRGRFINVGWFSKLVDEYIANYPAKRP